MRVLVTGGRTFADKAALVAALDRLQAVGTVVLVIHGAADGADTLADAWAAERGIDRQSCPAEWDNLKAPGARIRTNRYGKQCNANAGADRNGSMLRDHKPDLVVAFPGGPGTANMIKQARGALVPVWEPP